MNIKTSYMEISLLILVSFSPLISQPIKAALVLLILLLNYKHLIKFDKRNSVILATFLGVFMLGMAFDLRNVSSINQINILNLYFPICIIVGFIISEKYTLNSFLYFLDKVIFVFTACSLIGVFVYSFIPSLVTYLPSYNYYHTTHKTGYIFNILIGYDGILSRNAGIAWEPGAFQFLVNLGLYAYLKNSQKVNLLKVAIYSLAVITTKSTAGIIIFILITMKLFLYNRAARLLIIVSLIVFSGLIMEELIYQYQYKLFGSLAFENRLEPLMNAYQEGAKHFFGLGNSGFDNFYRNSILPPWDSFGQIFIRYGYILLIFIVLCLFKLIKDNKILFIIILITFSSQNIWFFPIVTPFYFLFKNKNNTLELKYKEV